MLLANNHFTPIIGIDIHFTIMGNPFHPYIGIVVDPFDYIPFIGSTVNINGIKRGNSTTQGIIIPLFHFSIFGGLFIKELPPAPFKTGESMNFFGSKNVYCEENRFTPKGFFTMTCNDIGIPLSLEPGKSWKSPIPSLFMPLAGSIPISYGDPVNVGPPYVPDFKAMIQDLVTSYGFGCLLKGVGNKVAESLKKLRKALGESSSKSSNKLGDLLCKLGFEPINLINGSVTYFGTDFEISSPFPIKWDRVWDSDNEFSGWLGYGVQCSYDRCVEIYEENNVIGLRLEDGRISAFPLLDIGEDFYNRTEKIKLTRYSDYYEALDYNTFNTYIFDSYNGKDKYRLSKIINKAGFSTHLHLDGDILTMIEDCAGRKIKAYTNSNGNILRLSLLTDEGEENLISYEYDYLGNMSAIIDALGQKTDIKYHQHLMIEKTDRNGQKFYWEYDGETTGARCIHTWGDGGWQEGWIEYHPDKGYNLVKDANGAITTYYYEPNQLVTEIKDPLGNSKFFEYTEFMEIYREIDEEGYMTGYTYDDFGNRTSVVYPDTTMAQSIYDEDQRLSISIDAEGHQTSYIYDEDHKYLVRSIIEPNNAITVFDYNELGLITTLCRENSESKLAYDEEHNLVSFEDDEGNITRWNYNHRGEVISIVSPENKTQSFTYDPLGRVVSIKNVENNITTLTYNAYDEVIEAKDHNHTIKFDYTPLGSLRMREENKSKVYFDYDKMEQLVGITNEHNERYSFLRNKAGHIVQETGFDGTTKQYTCNRNGWITRTNKEQDTWEEYQYDATGRIVRIDHNDGTWESFNYNKAGLLVECRNQDIDILLTRDKMGRVIKETQQYGYQKEECFSIISEYDKLGNRTQMTSTLGAEIQNQYDIRGLLSHIRANTSTHKENDNISWEAQIIRNKIGQEVERIVQGGLKIHHQYDPLGRVAQHRVSRAGKDTYHRHYTWNANHQLKQTLDAITGGKTQFAYDAFGSLQSAQYQDGSYDYKMPDAVGNLYRTKDQTDRTYHKGGKLLHDEKYHYLYDPNGNLKLKTPRKVAQRQIDLRQEQLNAHKPKKFSFFVEEVPQHKTKDLDYYLRNDRTYTQAEKEEYKRLKQAENLQTQQDQQWQRGDWEYSWNANGSLKSVKLPDGNLVEYEYDALGRRTKKICNNKIIRYLWDNNVLLHEWEYDKTEAPRRVVNKLGEVSFDKPEPVQNLITWVYETGSFVPCAKITENGCYSIINDYIGRPIQAYDNNGKLVWQTDYDIYGNLRNLKGEKDFIPFRQLGQYEDVETGLYYNRFRYYDPNTGTYISLDPIGLAGNNPTLYGYVSDANSEVDVFGLTTQMVGDMPMGDWGEKVASKYLKKQGHTILGSIQNASGHGFDLITKTADGYINIIEIKTSQSHWRSKSNMSTWTKDNINKIFRNTNGRWSNMPDYQKNLLDTVRKAKADGRLNNKLLQINIDKRSIRLKCK